MANTEEHDLEDVANTEVEASEVENVEEETIDETTLAAASLATHPVGKADAMAHLLGHMNSMSKGEAIDFFQKVMAQFGPGKDYGVDDKSGANQATIDSKLGAGPKSADPMPHLNVKEDIEDMFKGQDLSEEFKENVATLFEAAVSARVIAEQTRLEEEFEDALTEAVANINEELSSKLNVYLDHVVGNWMEENEVAIESTLRNELAGEFIEGLKNLFAEQYIDVPEDKVDALEALADKVSVPEGKLDETISENVELKNMILEAQATEIFEELSSDLALTQRDKFSALAEGVEFDGDLDTYAKKLMVVKENYFGNENTSYSSSNIEEETFEGEITESVVNIDPTVGRYVQALTRTVKNK